MMKSRESTNCLGNDSRLEVVDALIWFGNGRQPPYWSESVRLAAEDAWEKGMGMARCSVKCKMPINHEHIQTTPMVDEHVKKLALGWADGNIYPTIRAGWKRQSLFSSSLILLYYLSHPAVRMIDKTAFLPISPSIFFSLPPYSLHRTQRTG